MRRISRHRSRSYRSRHRRDKPPTSFRTLVRLYRVLVQKYRYRFPTGRQERFRPRAFRYATGKIYFSAEELRRMQAQREAAQVLGDALGEYGYSGIGQRLVTAAKNNQLWDKPGDFLLQRVRQVLERIQRQKKPRALAQTRRIDAPDFRKLYDYWRSREFNPRDAARRARAELFMKRYGYAVVTEPEIESYRSVWGEEPPEGVDFVTVFLFPPDSERWGEYDFDRQLDNTGFIPDRKEDVRDAGVDMMLNALSKPRRLRP
jgi:hypothetical protein